MKMEKDDIGGFMFTPCGVNCKLCYKHCESKDACLGCRSGGRTKPKHCQTCKIKSCVGDRGLDFCYLCEAYPCESVKRLDKTYKKKYGISLIDNAKYVRDFGLENFMEDQKKKYTCGKCGGVISVHSRLCNECGASC